MYGDRMARVGCISALGHRTNHPSMPIERIWPPELMFMLVRCQNRPSRVSQVYFVCMCVTTRVPGTSSASSADPSAACRV